MKRMGIRKDGSELIDNLIDSSPENEWVTYMLILQSNPIKYARLNLARLIEMLEAHELELRKKTKMKSVNIPQDIGLYYKGSDQVIAAQTIQTTFGAKSVRGNSFIINSSGLFTVPIIDVKQCWFLFHSSTNALNRHINNL
ncbi:hypothetical protein HanIR_Chr07g0303911 [Helianthus annuus]|nr:hypothetical protein HanIR_Chr07g0303911 [Helianthus annuus]